MTMLHAVIPVLGALPRRRRRVLLEQANARPSDMLRAGQHQTRPTVGWTALLHGLHHD